MADTKNEEVQEGVNDLPDPTVFSHVDGEGRPKRKKKHSEERPLDINVNSLLDVLSVILVFLMKSYSTNSVQIKPSPDLQVPFSHSLQQVQESAAITVTQKAILLNDKPVMALESGQVPEAERSSGGFLIDPLFRALQEEVEHQKKIAKFNKSAEFQGVVTIIVDRNVPFKVLTQVMYTAGQAEFGKFKFAVIKTERA